MKRIWWITLASLLVIDLAISIRLLKTNQPLESPRVEMRLSGEQALEHLKREGSYDSLGQAISASLYKIDAADDDKYRANNLAQQFRTSFTTRGITITSRGSATQQVTMRLSGLGYGEDLSPVTSEPGLTADGNRIVYEYRSGIQSLESKIVEEWYVNRPGGLEQGFTLNNPPEQQGESRLLRVALELGGELQPVMNDAATGIAFHSASGEIVLNYSGLIAFDASGREMPSQIKLEAGRVYLEVDDAGAHYPVTIDPNWTQQSKLTAPDGHTFDEFGHSISISGDTVAIGADFTDTERGSVYVFIRSGATWSLQQKLTVFDGGGCCAFFGDSVAIDGNNIVIGSSSSSSRGAAFVFVRSGTSWSEQQKLTASDGAAADHFGSSVGISGDTLVVGAIDDDVGSNGDQGSAYVFVRSGTTWSQQRKLTASDGEAGDEFGDSVAIEGNTVLVGAPNALSTKGAAYVWVRSGTTWSLQQRLLAEGQIIADVRFGGSVAISGNTVVIGAPEDDLNDPGAAFVFVRSGTVWSQQQKLKASDGEDNANFGNSVSIDGDTIVVGAHFDSTAFVAQGSVYVFGRVGSVWSQQQKLTAPDGGEFDHFGESVAIDDHYMAVGAPKNGIGGAAYVLLESSPNPIVVTNTNDSGFGSLRAALISANSINGPDIISFNISFPFGAVKTITLATPLPAITEALTIDGTTQPGYSGSPLIEINGQNVFGSGLDVEAGDSLIKALAINRFVGAGIGLSQNGNNTVQNCYIGTDATGTIDRGNGLFGISISSPDNLIGGASSSARNIVSGNGQNGIAIGTAAATGNTVQNNRIGTNATGGGAIGNGSAGVFVDAAASANTITSNLIAGNGSGVNLAGSSNTVKRNFFGVSSNGVDPIPNTTNVLISGSNNSVGTSLVSDKNTIIFGTGAGIAVTGGTGNVIFANSLNSNGGLGIDLGNNGVTANDAGDPDTGPNNLLNYPVLTSAITAGISITIQATLNSTPQALFTVDFYWSAAADASGFGEGQNYIGSRQVFTEDSGNTEFTASLSPVSIPAGSVITALTRDGSGNSSEFSRAVAVGDSNACGTLELNPTSSSPGDAGGSGLVNVIKAAGCNWVGVSNNSWITITGGSPGAGNGIVTYNVASNPNPGAPRTGTMTIGGQTFTVFQSHGPTAIQDLSASVTSFDNGTLVEWRTGLEVSNLGFNLYREDSGKRVVINPQLIAGSALVAGSQTVMTAGRAYGWFDPSPSDNSAAYWLEAIDISGRSTSHGPYYATQSSGSLPASKITRAGALAKLGLQTPDAENATRQLEAAAVLPEAAGTDLDLQEAIASGEAIKIAVRRGGWYRVTQPELARAGLDVRVNPRMLRMFVDGLEVPLLVTGESDGVFDPVDAIEFCGTGLDTPSTDTRVYWLVAGDSEGRRLKLTQSFGKSGGARSFSCTAERKERTIYFSSLLNGEAENFFGPVVSSQPVDQSLTLYGIDAGDDARATLEVALQGVTDIPANPDHRVVITLNGTIIGSLSFDGRTRKVEQISVPQALLAEGTNTITLMAQAGSADISLVDYVRLTYSHTFTAERDALAFTVPEGTQTQTISGFSSPDIRVFDVTDPVAITEIGGVIEQLPSGYSVTVDMPGKGPRTLIAMTSARILPPLSIGANTPSRLRQALNGADLLLITSRELISSVEPLAAHRRRQGLSVVVVDIEDIYDEFNFGNKSPQAIKEFLEYATTSWKKKPRYVLLAGDASYDPRGYLGFGLTDLVPTHLMDTEFMETASDDWFADFDNDGLAEMSVGRLPARTYEEAEIMVGKLIRYDQSKPSEEALLVADRNDGFDFEGASLAIESLLTGQRVNEIFRSRTDDATAKNLLIDALNRGQRLVNYAGHGSSDSWRGGLLNSNDARELENSRLAPFVMMSCLNGYFQDVGMDSLGEGLIKAPRGGAVAVWASSGMTRPNEQTAIDQEFYRQLFGGRSILGDAIRNAKSVTADLDVRRTWILLGDPTMRVR